MGGWTHTPGERIHSLETANARPDLIASDGLIMGPAIAKFLDVEESVESDGLLFVQGMASAIRVVNAAPEISLVDAIKKADADRRFVGEISGNDEIRWQLGVVMTATQKIATLLPTSVDAGKSSRDEKLDIYNADADDRHIPRVNRQVFAGRDLLMITESETNGGSNV